MITYVDSLRIYSDHVRVDTLIGEASGALKVSRVVAGTMVSNEQWCRLVDIIVGGKVDAVTASSAAALYAEGGS